MRPSTASGSSRQPMHIRRTIPIPNVETPLRCGNGRAAETRRQLAGAAIRTFDRERCSSLGCCCRGPTGDRRKAKCGLLYESEPRAAADRFRSWPRGVVRAGYGGLHRVRRARVFAAWLQRRYCGRRRSSLFTGSRRAGFRPPHSERSLPCSNPRRDGLTAESASIDWLKRNIAVLLLRHRIHLVF